MTKYLLKLTWILVAGFALSFLTACEEENANTTEDLETYTTETIYELQERSGSGRGGCYELVFPVTLTFPDGTVSDELESFQDIRMAVRTWRADNPDVAGRPMFNFPLEVISEDGEIIPINNGQQLIRVRRACFREFRPNHGRGEICFRLVYPLTLVFPDGTTAEVAGPRAMQLTIRQWRVNNPDVEERPGLQFPISVTLEGGETMELADQQALQDLKESCGE